jgi:hypothetical protein
MCFDWFHLPLLHIDIDAYIFLKEFQCPESYVKCSDGLQCIHEVGMCNGYSYCNDKSDEDEHMCKGK